MPDEKDRSVAVFQVLVEEHAPMLVSNLAAVTGSKEDAEDLAQETFLKAYINFEKFGSKGANFAAWLRTIGRNLLVDRYRGSRRVAPVDARVLDGIEDIHAAADTYRSGDTWTERIATLRDCLNTLPERLHAACILHYFKGLTVRVISQKLDVKLNAVLKRLERARQALRECMERKLGIT